MLTYQIVNIDFFEKSNVNLSFHDIDFFKTNINKLMLTSVIEKSILTNLFYLQKCHHNFVNIDFIKN